MALLLANSAVDLSYWGYIEAVRELDQKIQLSGDVQFDDIVVACGGYFISTHYILFYERSYACLCQA
uniref:Uncharacterized protein n=1 Tax=Triticum aestivum TaxID=4565 RepID=A0A077RRF5_WHEAT|nr:unnamed protein product [Triticum aestivum]